ncbi:MAG: 1-pyrroline-5-carboxylate dehydrogenase [Bradymonadia bacterium]|jgi:1-pyrroline-5-carboxylate dehydrogenase
MSFKITYSVLDADMSELHTAFDAALADVRSQLGVELPCWIGDEPSRSGEMMESYNPSRTTELLAKAHSATLADVDRAMTIAKRAQKEWAATTWQHKVAVCNKAADFISADSLRYAAIMSLEVGKNRMECLGDVEESADLLRYYAAQLETHKGYVTTLNKLSPNEDTRSVLKPFGVFVVIAPFNYPAALAAGMSGGALLGGNAVILKPSEDAPWCTELLYESMAKAGFPTGLFQVLHGKGETIGDALVKHKDTDGVVFTGSSAVGHSIFRYMTSKTVRPAFLEMGGKNPAIIAADADLDAAVEGTYRSVFGLSGQKCSACSRVYVHESLRDAYVDKMRAKVEKMIIGDPTREEVFMGPVAVADSVERFKKASASAKADGAVLFGGELLTGGEFDGGYFVAPTMVEVPRDHWLEKTELFLPFATVSTFTDIDDAISRANDVDYGLTAGVYSADKDTVNHFLDNIEAGCVYTNRPAGATTGAWPGVQAFCGWKASGSTGKGGCGPYYVAQFMREQSQTRVL